MLHGVLRSTIPIYTMLVKKSILAEIYPPRDKFSFKGRYGKLLVIGGSSLYSGAPALNALAAYRAGCDLVTVVAPQRAADIVAGFAPDIITHALPGSHIALAHLETVGAFLNINKAFVIGGGMDRSKEPLAFVKAFLRHSMLPGVVDADAIHAIVGKLNENVVVTPHVSEFYVMTGEKLTNDIHERERKVKGAAKKFHCTIVLKGSVDVISDGKHVFTNTTGNPYMTVGGTGDTLAGICGALLARGVEPLKAACAATYINGAAGDLAATTWKDGMMASDLLPSIATVIKNT